MQISSRALIFTLCFSLSAAAQQIEAGSSAQVQSSVSSAQSGAPAVIHLNVVVTDKSGKPVLGLPQQEFTVLDNKKPTNILSFQAPSAGAPAADDTTEIVLVFDEVNTPFSRTANARLDVNKFLLQNGGKLAHPVSVAFFSYLGLQMQATPSRDGNSLIAMLDQHAATLRSTSHDGGRGAEEDQVQASLKAINVLAAKEQTKPGRKIVILISPGWPSMNGRRADFSSSQSKAMFNTLVYTATSLLRAGITLYSVDPMGMANADIARVANYKDFLKGVPSQDQVQVGNIALQVFATQTGGQVVYGDSSVLEEINRCVADLDAFYTLTIPVAPADHPSTYHGIDVNMATKGLKARTLTGYYAQP
jgi:VWFA-related protein